MAALTEGAALERDDVDLKTLAAVLWRQKIFIALCAALFLGLGSFQILSTFPVYQADTLIQLEQRNRAPIIFRPLSPLMAESLRPPRRSRSSPPVWFLAARSRRTIWTG